MMFRLVKKDFKINSDDFYKRFLYLLQSLNYKFKDITEKES